VGKIFICRLISWQRQSTLDLKVDEFDRNVRDFIYSDENEDGVAGNPPRRLITFADKYERLADLPKIRALFVVALLMLGPDTSDVCLAQEYGIHIPMI